MIILKNISFEKSFNIYINFTNIQTQSFTTDSNYNKFNSDVLQLIYNASLIVKIVLFFLILFSILSWAIILTKYITIQKAKKQNIKFEKTFCQAESLLKAYTQTKYLSASPLANIFSLAYNEIEKIIKIQEEGYKQQDINKKIIENIQRTLIQGQTIENNRLSKFIPFLATCANTSPFIGLFGTIWGIIDSFSSIGITGTTNLTSVAPGIAEALIATATGLLAAIPAVIFYNYFNHRLSVLDNETTAFIQNFLNLLERNFIIMNYKHLILKEAQFNIKKNSYTL